ESPTRSVPWDVFAPARSESTCEIWVAGLRRVLPRELLGAEANRQLADAAHLDTIVEDRDSDVAVGEAQVAVDDRVDDRLTECLGRHRLAVLPEDAAFGKARRERQRAIEPRDRLAHHREGVQV